jgi:hypothetical protein
MKWAIALLMGVLAGTASGQAGTQVTVKDTGDAYVLSNAYLTATFR